MKAVPRHNINLDDQELTAVMTEILGGSADPGEILAFEREIAEFHEVGHAIAVSSGRAAQGAIMLAMGLPAGAPVVVPAYAFQTVPAVVSGVGCTPTFAPCHTRNYAMDPERLEKYVPTDAAAVIIIHPFGQTAPVDRIEAFCRSRNIPMIEDASQSIGAKLHGRRVGTFGTAACMSLVHGKNLMTFGGGLVLTDDAGLAKKVRNIVAAAAPEPEAEVRKKARSGMINWALTTRPGFAAGLLPPFWALNLVDRARLDRMFVEPEMPFSPASIRPMSAFQAKLGRMQLKKLDARNAVRQHNAQRLLAGLGRAQLPTGVASLPEILPDSVCTWNAFPLRVPNPETVQRALLMRGVDTRNDYMTVYGFRDEWERDGRPFYLPNHPGMNDGDVDYVVAATAAILGGGRG